ncbi:MAG: glycosyl hydrolase 115 family protein [Bacteroides sp.]|nr:glycosyl hydrolase 115 family protein [Bacteroides sp.]
MKRIIVLVCGALLPCLMWADVVFTSGKALKVSLSKKEAEVVYTALDILKKDYRQVFGAEVLETGRGQVIIGTIGTDNGVGKQLAPQTLDELKRHREAFALQVKDGKLYIVGSDKRGTAYGILELSRLMGVSPWEWWADAAVAPKENLVLEEGFSKLEYPSVKHRGIFINDEDWGLMPWSGKTYEPSDRKGNIGPKTHGRVFELLLRLRANTFWPAMHGCSVPFYLVPGNKEAADKYGIYVGTSHCEPMVCNTNGEWKRDERGAYNYLTNREGILKFWEERVTKLADSDNIYTLGLRGEHDSRMQGAKTVAEQKEVLIQVLKDQREMIARHVNPNVEQVSQVFIPYKEVLDVYNAGLEVPEDVSLMWCDDNYGYIRHFPTPAEAARKGGNGVYYHVSYWGRPHDYLWISTNHPAQLYAQMKMAYDKNARDMWILNVGDIKPAEYLTELFMDMAWDIDAIESNERGLAKHLHDWMQREFGTELAKELLPVMNEYYRLAYIRKPEFMGNTRTEEKDPKYKVVKDLPWTKEEVETRLKEYTALADKVVALSKQVPAGKRSAWLQLVEYPVRGAAEMNKKHLYAQLARHGLAAWEKSDAAYDTIVALTEAYNSLGNGKWKGIMDHRPRRLAVFDKVPHTQVEAPMLTREPPLCLLDGKDYISHRGGQPVCYGLGYRRGAVHLAKGASVTYELNAVLPDSIDITVALAPTHPVEGKQLRYAISVNGGQPCEVDYHTEGRSEEWKENVLTNQARRTTRHTTGGVARATVTLTALDEGVVVDQITVR